MLTIAAMDHIVLNVHDMDTMLDFYMNVLGLEGERIDAFRQGQVPFPSVRISKDTLIDLFPVQSSSGDSASALAEKLNHFCMVIEPTDMQQVVAHLEANGVVVDEGPVTRWGAHGNGMSIYFNDPEKNRIEIRYYED